MPLLSRIGPDISANKSEVSNKRRTTDTQIRISATLQNAVHLENDHNLTVTKLKCLWKKYKNFKKMKVTSSSRILMTT